jgi:hypothetical protein
VHSSQLNQQYFFLLLGILTFVLAVQAAWTGKLRGRFGDVTYRVNSPKQYWSGLAMYCLLATGFIARYLYLVHTFSN